MADDQREALWELRQNAGMALTSKEKQEAFRARQAMLGLKEVRGIFLPDSLHEQIKQIAADLLKKQQKATPPLKSITPPPIRGG